MRSLARSPKPVENNGLSNIVIGITDAVALGQTSASTDSDNPL
jgi:hypothetical protein